MKKLVAPTQKLLNSLSKYLVAAILIAIPLYPKFPLFTVPFTYVSIRAEDFLISITWTVFILKFLIDKKVRLPKISFQIIVFIAVVGLSSLSAILVTQNVRPLLVLLHYFRRIEYISLLFFVYWAAKDSSSRKYFLELSILPSIGVFLYGIAQIYFGAPVISTMDSESSKGIALTLRPGVTLNSTFAGHYDLAIYLTMMMTFLVGVTSSISSWFKRLPIISLFVALLWLFMQAGSRIGLVGLMISIGLVCYFYRQYLLGFIFWCMVVLMIGSSPQYIARFQNLLKVFQSKFTYIVPAPVFAATKNTITPTPTPTTILLPTPTPEIKRAIQLDTSSSIRFDVEWPRAMRAFYKNPLLGTGYSSLTLATDNDYLRSLGETGILGLIAFLSILFFMFRSLLNLSIKNIGTDKLIAVSALGILVSFAISAMFIDVFESSKVAILFWSYTGLALSTEK